MDKLLTVVIPTYNAEMYLQDCLDSLLKTALAEQTEILVVDDGSKDGSGLIADTYARDYQGIVRVIHKDNGGHGSAINVGMQQASGKYFKVIDSDDFVKPDRYDKYLQQLEKQDADLVVARFACVTILKKGRCKYRERIVEGTEKLPYGQILEFQDVADTLHVRMHEWTIRTSILHKYNILLTENSFYVDMQFIMFPIPWVKTIYLMPYSVYCYRLGEESQSVSVKNMQKNRIQHQAVLFSLIHYYNERRAAGDSQATLHYLARGIAKMEANQVQIALSLPLGESAYRELIEAEKKLKEECPAAYEANNKKSLWLLRKSGYVLYCAAAGIWKMTKR